MPLDDATDITTATTTAMATTPDGVSICYQSTGSGIPIVFVHEFAGDMRSWEPQVQRFSGSYRTVTFNARGYPPSAVPESVSSYSQDHAVADIVAVMDAAGIDKAHIVGLSMGGFATLHFGMQHPERALSLCVAGCGYGAEPGEREKFRAEAKVIAEQLIDSGMQAFAQKYAYGPTRVQFARANPRGFELFKQQLSEHSALGSANTQLGVQRERPSLYDLKDRLAKITVPTLIVNGDEDWGCARPGIMLKETIPSAALAVIPNCGHTMNLEATDAFNALLANFWATVQTGRWPMRDPRAVSKTITGIETDL
ncbi:MAG: alpha/beta hydrolase [Burkholderiaceae bacterium]|nr:alpha/beta hydrolase [Burkholderiaceae bacterium]MCD8517001.1 alpha/beta hydrolase [Burkholderiaceae bacterium]